MAIFYRFSSPYVCVCVCLYTHTCGVFAYFWGMQDSAWYLASGSHLVILIEEMNEQSTDRGKPQWHGITWTGIWDRRSEKASQGMKMWMNLKVKESPTSWVGQEMAFLAWGEMYVNKRAVLCLAAQLCLTLCDPMDSSPPGPSVHGDSPGENTGMGCHALLQGILPTQGSNPGLPHCRQILYQLSHQDSWVGGYTPGCWNHLWFHFRIKRPGR